jgi:hypothetical protein
VIATFAADAGIGLAGELERGGIAYIDAEWIPEEPAVAVPAIVVDGAERSVRFADEPPLSIDDASDPDAVAARLVVRLCRLAAATATEAHPGEGEVEVWGRGIVARGTAALLQTSPVAPGTGRPTHARPSVIVDTTGEPAWIVEATRRLSDLGTLVLVGESLDRHLSLDLYRDVHSRGLRVVGVPRLSDLPVPQESDSPRALAELTSALTEARLGSVLVAGGAWYRVA